MSGILYFYRYSLLLAIFVVSVSFLVYYFISNMRDNEKEIDIRVKWYESSEQLETRIFHINKKKVDIYVSTQSALLG